MQTSAPSASGPAPVPAMAPSDVWRPEPVEPRTAVVDVVIPVYNEEAALPGSIERLQEYLANGFPFSWVITIADNASTDGTLAVAEALASRLSGVRVRHLDQKGRGRALRSAWTESDSDVVAYMDVDLSTDLDAFLPLVAPLVSGHSDVAIGSRLAPGAAVARGPKREAISRTYNAILRTMFATQVRDMQCGFKAVRRDVATSLLPAIEDQGWFFDTELLLLAERNGLRIHQVPVDWVDDPDSRVHVTSTAIDDLRGAFRLAALFSQGGGRIEELQGRHGLEDDFGRRIVSFAAIGVASTIVSLVLFLLLRVPIGAVAANVVALTVTFLGNTWLNARFSYRADRPRWRAVGIIYLATLLASTLALIGVDALGGGLVAQVATLVTVWALAGAARLLHLNRFVRGGNHA